MSTGTAPAFVATVTMRKVPRYKLTVPLDLTVLRSGVPDRVHGHTLEVGEGGLGVVTAARLLVGESVRVEFLVPHMNQPVRATAVVRYQSDRCFGLQFLRLPAEQQSIIRYWTRREAELVLASQPRGASPEERVEDPGPLAVFGEVGAGEDFWLQTRPKIMALVAVVVVAVLLGWWRWEQGWSQLEAQVPVNAAAIGQPQLQVPPETMEGRVVHKFLPEYPEAARLAGVQGSVKLETMVGPDGSVTQVKFMSGPAELSQAAIDAVRWWRYEPYVVNGQPVTVQTTVAVNFRLAK